MSALKLEYHFGKHKDDQESMNLLRFHLILSCLISLSLAFIGNVSLTSIYI